MTAEKSDELKMIEAAGLGEAYDQIAMLETAIAQGNAPEDSNEQLRKWRQAIDDYKRAA